MTNVIAVDFRPELSTFDEAWALVPVTMRKRCKRLSVLREAWDRHGRTFGHVELLGCLRAYVLDKDFSRHGGQALDRWLAAGRYEHFTPIAASRGLPQFHDASVRLEVCKRLGEEFAALYLDPCSQSGTALIARTQIAVDRMLMHREVFRALGFTGIRKRRVSDG